MFRNYGAMLLFLNLVLISIQTNAGDTGPTLPNSQNQIVFNFEDPKWFTNPTVTPNTPSETSQISTYPYNPNAGEDIAFYTVKVRKCTPQDMVWTEKISAYPFSRNIDITDCAGIENQVGATDISMGFTPGSSHTYKTIDFDIAIPTPNLFDQSLHKINLHNYFRFDIYARPQFTGNIICTSLAPMTFIYGAGTIFGFYYL